ncbi:DNA polymerase III subunit gamma and tau [Actinomadura litoris]|uniref:DNA-directed DNA polymerase n=1 Tax=Actinomadura litoris TaxID=2678616 RepID=A0A7K1L0U0_9ACTN|nr:DNA polymerase III subunit gamma and tau [Actinomadura litoris]MUN38019.1 DNA polymerase III subunit gamma and tau [Actinomadura litoris]
MSLALYRKYRPATFAELKGQEHVAEPLRQALRNGRINHAYLFSGPRGCGKTSSARILARSLNCEQGPTADPCGECDSCVALGPSGSGHIDVIEIDAASHGGVDDARDLRERAFFAPVSARFKVYIIDEAHMVTREGFNALLKLVEEPPPHLKFVFATTEPEKVIGTIRSRTHHYPFRLIPPGVLQDLVEEILRSEKVPYEESALPLAVRAGAGSARDTLSILDQLLAGSDEQGITYTRAVSLLGYTDSALLDEVVAAFAARDGAAVFAAIDRVVESGQDPRRFTADLLERVRDLVILSNVPDAGGSGLLNVPADELEQMRRQASSMGPGELTRAADLLHTGLTEMRGATSPRLLLELISARILLPAAYEDEASMFARLDRLERTAAQGGFAGGGQGGAQGGGGLAPAFQAGQGAPVPGAPGRATPPGGGGRPGQDSAQGSPQGSAQSPAQSPAQGSAPGPAQSSASRPAQGSAQGSEQNPAGQPPPAQGGDPTSSVNRRPGSPEAERGSVDNRSNTPVDNRPDNRSDHRPVNRPSQPAAPTSPAPPASPAPQAAAPGGGMDVGTVQQYWPDIVEAVKQVSRATWMVIMSGVRPVALDGRVLTLSFDAEGSRLGFVNGNRDVILCEVLKERMGVDWRIETVVGGGSPPAGGRPGGRPGGGGSPPNRGGGNPGGGQGTRPGGQGGGNGGNGGTGSGFGSSPAAGFGGASDQAAPAGAPSGAPAPSAGAQPGRAPAPRTGQGDPGPMPPPPDEPPPPPDPGPVDESDEVDPEGDADADGTEAEMSGMALIQRELGGQIIKEIDNT